jgi:hypothetical protein
MIKFIKLNLVIGAIFCFASCAIFSTSMSPMEVNNTLPSLTKSEFISQAKANEAAETNRCKYLVKGRNYTAPIGLTVKGDLKRGAKWIDEWVELDGGNAYVLINYKWETVGENGSTQLHIEFDTMLCE